MCLIIIVVVKYLRSVKDSWYKHDLRTIQYGHINKLNKQRNVVVIIRGFLLSYRFLPIEIY